MRLSPPGAGKKSRLARLQLTSMIDIVFLLLFFFMATTTLSSPESRLSSGLLTERDDSARAADFQPQIVEARIVDGAPAFVLGQRVFRDKESLTQTLRDLPKEAGVFVRVFGDVRIDWVAAALQACEDAGFARVNYVPAK
jgi:biopolymer transport protein ExbD